MQFEVIDYETHHGSVHPGKRRMNQLIQVGVFERYMNIDRKYVNWVTNFVKLGVILLVLGFVRNPDAHKSTLKNLQNILYNVLDCIEPDNTTGTQWVDLIKPSLKCLQREAKKPGPKPTNVYTEDVDDYTTKSDSTWSQQQVNLGKESKGQAEVSKVVDEIPRQDRSKVLRIAHIKAGDYITFEDALVDFDSKSAQVRPEDRHELIKFILYNFISKARKSRSELDLKQGTSGIDFDIYFSNMHLSSRSYTKTLRGLFQKTITILQDIAAVNEMSIHDTKNKLTLYACNEQGQMEESFDEFRARNSEHPLMKLITANSLE